MGLRIRKSIKLGKHLKINLSKSGVSLSGGVRGARMSLSSKGVVRNSIGLVGTGIYYTKQHKIGAKHKNIDNKAKFNKNGSKNDNVKHMSFISFLCCTFIFAIKMVKIVSIATIDIVKFIYIFIWKKIKSQNAKVKANVTANFSENSGSTNIKGENIIFKNNVIDSKSAKAKS